MVEQTMAIIRTLASPDKGEREGSAALPPVGATRGRRVAPGGPWWPLVAGWAGGRRTGAVAADQSLL